jgi:acetylornithine deacetylase/succinyl-diaminopimelate desuccinylase-like protein
MDTAALHRYISDYWDDQVLPTLMDYIRIPNQSPMFDPQWQEHGHMSKAVALVGKWMADRLPEADFEALRDGAHTPILLADVPGTGRGTVLMYGHLDKQPPFSGWRPELDPWKPVLDDEGRLYGRGGADDGYAAFAAVTAIRAATHFRQSHGRIVILIECSEESGSTDLPYYLNAYGHRMGDPDLVICLDSGCGDYERLWSTTSLRGLVMGTVRIDVLTEGVHSGMAGGIVPTPFTVARALFDRLEDPATGAVRPAGLHVEIPPERREQARQTALVLGGAVSGVFPWVEGLRPLADTHLELLLNNTWRPSLAVVGQAGMPDPEHAGNVLLHSLTYKFSLRTPPTLDANEAAKQVKELLERDPPFGAKVAVHCTGSPGWDAPPLAPWLRQATEAASREFYGKEACSFGVGGSIPFMHMIGEKWPRAQFFITGVLGPASNAHGPNEFLHVPYTKRLTACLVRILAAHAAARQTG